ncbi:PucR family transcriptional regulator ligand-binding domain-containing protein [Bacillus tianshenii]|nr:PucR family transcriptional regulator ligand-binding domain-containing protein [Bacillus tianshenii]
MGINVHEALQLPTMSQTKLAGGAGGLHNTIKWVTVVEVIEDINRLQEGEFLITTGYGLEDYKNEFHKLLSIEKLSGVAIYTSFYISKIPESFIQLADKHNLPLIEIPTDINFSTITKEILQQILNKQMELTSFSLNIHKKLTRLVLQNKGKKAIIETLGQLIHASVFLLDDTYSPLYEHNRNNVHYADRYVYFNNKRVCDVARFSFDKQASLLFHKTIGSDILICVPIIANETTFGYILAVKEQINWSEFDNVAIEHAATVYALEFLKEAAVEAAHLGIKGEFLEEVFNKNFKDKSTVIEQAKKLDYDLTTSQSVLFVQFKKEKKLEDILFSNIDALYQFSRKLLTDKNINHLIRAKRNELYILFENLPSKGMNEHAQSIHIANALRERWIQEKHDEIVIGIGRTYDDIYLLGRSAQEAKNAIYYSPLLFNEKDVVHYNELGTFHFLIHQYEQGLHLKEFYIDTLQPLISQQRSSLDFIHTLEVYFKNNQSIQLTSSELFIHRHTLKYRLDQIQKKTGLNLHSPDEKLKLQLSVLAYKLDQYMKQQPKKLQKY